MRAEQRGEDEADFVVLAEPRWRNKQSYAGQVLARALDHAVVAATS